MSKFILLYLVSLLSWQVQAGDVEAMLAKADHYRLSETSARVVSLVKLYQHGVLEKTRQYEVYVRPNRESLVIFKSKVEAGQKLLMLGDNYWLLMPRSRRPIRITPMQKLLGDASVGDISTLNWSEHYQATLLGTETLVLQDGGVSKQVLPGPDLQGQSVLPRPVLRGQAPITHSLVKDSSVSQSFVTHKLVLKAKTKGASYQRIVLWLDQSNDFPLKADLYLRSGKLAKEALFSADGRTHPLKVGSMTLLDRIQPAKKTVIEYQQSTPYQLAAKYYNPAYLVTQTRIDPQ